MIKQGKVRFKVQSLLFSLFSFQVYAWGQNNCGQVGTGTTANQPTPRKISAVIGEINCFR